jgi:hypothetical protein
MMIKVSKSKGGTNKIILINYAFCFYFNENNDDLTFYMLRKDTLSKSLPLNFIHFILITII